MRERAVSSISVVLVGLIPAIIGGPVFMIAFVSIAIVSNIELTSMMRVTPSPVIWSGYVLIGACGLIPLLWRGDQRLPLTLALVAMVPIFTAIFVVDTASVDHWMRTMASIVYLGIPTFAAVDMRELTGTSAAWLASIATWLPLGRDDTGGGLGWLLVAILVTWMTDTGAYLVGKAIGRHKLIPRISPGKTVEGAAGGLAAAMMTSVVCIPAFGLDVAPGLAALMGLVLGTVGMLGDLAESMLKRHAGVKDSGSLIPGHGGILDRIDGLLFVIIATWLVVPVLS
ncbi:MAG: Phosphatidate cytidylyltransferase [uncultured Thermomicrobiales bacterium]|uniref:Phosphatidate cytidylyltransferase n=1 Tax=uncultured Thermomicrobiales bacterium TaxID=1645740 RepID=A0A6J4UV98_9BACT|nr:MAG: Phosphatidate cytidylyltransferase [uncultured Thermomicrobiales bacterium]